MKKITILAAFLFILGAYQANAQVGIGTPSPSDATMLEIMATDKGVLIPRVKLTSTTVFAPITGTQEESILVYNTVGTFDPDITTTVYPGFYYWQNAAWQRIVNQADLNLAIENLDNEFNTSIEQIHDLINYIAPSNPNNFDENGNPIVVENHSTVVWDGNSFYVVTYAAGAYVKTLIDIDALVAGLETNTFIRKVDAVLNADGSGEVISPTVYYYFSEEAIKDWMAADVANVDPTTMPVTAPGVIAIEVADDVANNFEYILNQTITYEGQQVTIEEIIQLISSQVNGNVIYTEINPGEWVFQYFNGTDYVTINLGDLVANLETKTQITRAAIATDGDTANYVDTLEPAATVAGQILYKYEAEGSRIDYLNITEDMLFAIENNEAINTAITNILNSGGNVLFGDVTIGGQAYTNVLYYIDANGDPQLVEIAPTLIQNLIDNSTHLQELKNVLGDKYVDNTIIYTGDTINGNPVAAFTTTTTIGIHTAVTGGVTLPVTPVGVVAISIYKNGVLVTNSVTDVKVAGDTIDFNIGVGTFYQVLPQGAYEVIIEFTVAP